MTTPTNSLIGNYNKAPTKPNVPAQQDAKPLPLNEQFKALMSAQSWELLMQLLNWAVVYEKMATGESVEFTDEVRNVLMSPFTLFGANMQLYTSVAGHMVPVLLHNIVQYESDEVYRAANPMPWLVLQSAGPLLSQRDFGPDAMRQCVKVLTDLKQLKELPV